jgi:hypothetical protein
MKLEDFNIAAPAKKIRAAPKKARRKWAGLSSSAREAWSFAL